MRRPAAPGDRTRRRDRRVTPPTKRAQARETAECRYVPSFRPALEHRVPDRGVRHRIAREVAASAADAFTATLSHTGIEHRRLMARQDPVGAVASRSDERIQLEPHRLGQGAIDLDRSNVTRILQKGLVQRPRAPRVLARSDGAGPLLHRVPGVFGPAVRGALPVVAGASPDVDELVDGLGRARGRTRAEHGAHLVSRAHIGQALQRLRLAVETDVDDGVFPADRDAPRRNFDDLADVDALVGSGSGRSGEQKQQRNNGGRRFHRWRTSIAQRGMAARGFAPTADIGTTAVKAPRGGRR
ncbi:hypothetical protein GLE_2243 [Lysobacter enzymogenes]|uniref:Uncharacterized protein n=1 Tax=Lysobacter enzymogenes TaxID=69 RepID=A0A0S2DGW2_LYSEN|nr:hypothetical protein GLE_2243 [Lysobacter enzymogenes]